jgi:hypothetical protein
MFKTEKQLLLDFFLHIYSNNYRGFVLIHLFNENINDSNFCLQIHFNSFQSLIDQFSQHSIGS